MIVNQKLLASVLGISSRRVRQLREDGFFFCVENGKGYHLEKCVQEYIEYKVNAEMKKGTSIDKEKEQAEHERVKKEISKLKLRRMKKELHAAADVEMFLSEMLSNFKNRLLAIPNKVAIQIMGESDINRIIKLLTEELIDTLEELSEYNPDAINKESPSNYYDEDEDEEDDEEEEDDIPDRKADEVSIL
jgi:phage terminase Nu1 subunit (DNA packaging protein)